MYYYHVLVDTFVPFDLLTYSSETELAVGQLVRVGVRKREVLGIIIQASQNDSEFSDKIKPVVQTMPFVFASESLKFLSLFSYNTFNNKHAVCDALCTPLRNLNAKDWSTVTLPTSKQALHNTNITTPVFYREKETWVRIKYIIRSLISQPGSRQIAIICPEKSIVKKIIAQLHQEFADVSIHQYSGDKSKSSRATVTALMTQDSTAKLQIIIGTRATVFLPFSHLTALLMIDEANPFYIQEQNGLYYDTRDAVFYLSQLFSSQLFFVSVLPSVRLHSFYPESDLNVATANLPQNSENAPQLKVYEQNRRDLFFDLFSNEILNDIEVTYSEGQ